MGFRFDTGEEANEKDFRRASKEPGGRLAYLSRFPEAIKWIAKPNRIEQLTALGAIDFNGFKMPTYIRMNIIELIGKLDDEIALQLARSTSDIFPNLSLYSEKIQRQAVERSPQRIKSLAFPSEKVQLICATYGRCNALEWMSHLKPSEKVLIRAIQTDGSNIRNIKNPTRAMMEKAVRKNAENLQHIDSPPDDIIRMAISKSGMAIEYVPNPSDELQRLAVSKCAQAVIVIDNPLEELQVAAVRKSPSVIRRIKNPCEDAMWEALRLKPKLIRDMKYATPEMRSFVALIT